LIGTFDIVSGNISSPEHGMFGMIAAAQDNFKVIIPEDSETHGALIAKSRENINISIAKDLQEVWNIILGTSRPRTAHYDISRIDRKKLTRYVPDLKAIEGVSRAKRAIMVAMAGGHNILMVGPPGQGKSMLCSASTNLLPTLTHSEMFELNKIYSARGEIKGNQVILDRPFRDVSGKNTTQVALFGGGTPPRPGLVSLAHNGVLLLDEINLCPGIFIEQLRNTLSNRMQIVQRACGSVEFPCNFILVAAMNPCKCGWYGHYACPHCRNIYFPNVQKCPEHPEAKLLSHCTCTQREVAMYKDRLSEPLLDRIDLKVLVSAYDHSWTDRIDFTTTTARRHIESARKIQIDRFADACFGFSNAQVPDKSQFEKYCPTVSQSAERLIGHMYRSLGLTKRMEVKIYLVARTIADLDDSRTVQESHVRESIELMGLENEYFN